MNKFIISSGKIKVTDPYFDMDVWCSAILDNVKNGTWVAEATHEDFGVWGDRIKALLIYHDSVYSYKRKLKFRWLDVVIGVDSGLAGFHDYNKLKDIKINFQLNQDFEHWCREEITNDSDKVISNDFCVISHAGYGNGLYSLYSVSENDQIVAAKIVYIDDGLTEIDEV